MSIMDFTTWMLTKEGLINYLEYIGIFTVAITIITILYNRRNERQNLREDKQ